MAHGCIKYNTANCRCCSSGASLENKTSERGRANNTEDPYLSTLLAPARDGTNVTMFTWNATLVSNFSLHKVWRIISETHPDYLQFRDEWYIDDNPSKIFTNLGDSPQITNITRHAGEGELYRDWIDADLYDGWYVVYALTYESGDNGWIWYMYPGYNGYVYPIRNYCISDAPSLSFDTDTGNFSIGKSMTGRRFLEFYRTDRDYGYPTSISDEETLNEMLLTSVVSQEYDDPRKIYNGYYSIREEDGNGQKNGILHKWAKGTYTVGVDFRDTQNQTKINNAINSALSQLNGVLNSFGVYFKRSGTVGDMSIVVDTEFNLYGIDLETAGTVYGGTWQTNQDSSGHIVSATIFLANDVFDFVPYNTYETVALEEITQSMGAGYDQIEYPFNTLHTDFNYYNKSSELSEKDKNILRLIYSPYVEAGDNYFEVSKKLNIPKGVYNISTSTTDSVRTVSFSDFLDRGAKYRVRAFIVNSAGELSYTSPWINIETPALLGWSWDESNGSATASQTKKAYSAITDNGYVTDFGYKVWNDLVLKVSDTLSACGESWDDTYATYDKTKMSANDKTLTAARFNSLRQNIGSHKSTGITEKKKGEYVYGEYFTTLTDILNAWIKSI